MILLSGVYWDVYVKVLQRKNMKCPNCSVEMEKGSLAMNGGYWYKLSEDRGFLNQTIIWPITLFGSATSVLAWKCPNCNKLELTVEK